MGSILREGEEELDLKVAARLQEYGYKFYELPHVSSMVQMLVHSLSSWLSNRPPSITHVYPQLASYVKVRREINQNTYYTHYFLLLSSSAVVGVAVNYFRSQCRCPSVLLPWLVPSSGVAGIADDGIPPSCPVCCFVLFQTHHCHVSLACICPSVHQHSNPRFSYPSLYVIPYFLWSLSFSW